MTKHPINPVELSRVKFPKEHLQLSNLEGDELLKSLMAGSMWIRSQEDLHFPLSRLEKPSRLDKKNHLALFRSFYFV